jgi:Double-GTPase 2
VIDEKDETDVDVFDAARPETVEAPDTGWVSLPSADLLSVEDADALLRWRPANLVAIIGERNAGKTTLIAELYERFLRGPFGGQMFAHSLTLLGFEQRSYLSRAFSGAAKPKTPRTPPQDVLRFFHLGLVPQDLSGARTDLLVSERAGETYRNVRDRPAEGLSLTEVVKAKTVAFIVDGERLADELRRAEAFASARNIFRALADAGAIPASAEVQLVTTKFDLIAGDDHEVVRQMLSEFEERLAALYGPKFARFSTWRTAARDPEGVHDPAWGVAPLLGSWLNPPAPPIPEPAPIPPLTDECDRLLLRRRAMLCTGIS